MPKALALTQPFDIDLANYMTNYPEFGANVLYERNSW